MGSQAVCGALWAWLGSLWYFASFMMLGARHVVEYRQMSRRANDALIEYQKEFWARKKAEDIYPARNNSEMGGFVGRG